MLKKLILIVLIINAITLVGQINKSLVLNGRTDYLEVKDHNDLDFKDTLSAECWIKINCSDGMVFSKEWCSGRFSYYLNVSNSKLVWTFSKDGYCNSPNVYSSTNQVVPNDTFIHVAVMHTINNVSLFVNGEKISGGFISGGNGRIYAGSSPLRIGVYKGKPGNFGAHYSGYIDELRFWNTGLNESIIQSRMKKSLVGNEKGLILYLDMEDNGKSLV